MELGMHEGRVRWLKKDGTPSTIEVSTEREIEFLGFPIPCGPGGGGCIDLHLLLGNLYKDTRLVVKAGGNNWFGYYILVHGGDFQSLPNKTPQLIESNEMTLNNVDQYANKTNQVLRYESATEIAAEDLAEEKGLEVFEDVVEDIGEHIYWIKGRKAFVREMPKGWVLVPKGDASLTRKLSRKYPHWKVSHENQFGYAERLGVFVAEEAYKDAYKSLGGDEGRSERENKKQEAQRKQNERITEQLEESLRRQFPLLPADDLTAIVNCARREGCVGNASFLHFTKKEDLEQEFDRAAELAAAAHARHQYTDYDNLFAEGQTKEIARQEVRGDVNDKLAEWS